jgi:hypothetical protein
MAQPFEHDGLVSGLLLDGLGSAREVEWPEIKHWTPDAGALWVHLNRRTEEADHYVRHDAGLDPIVSLRRVCGDEATEVDCARGGQLTTTGLSAGQYYLVIDGYGGTSGDFDLEVQR